MTLYRKRPAPLLIELGCRDLQGFEFPVRIDLFNIWKTFGGVSCAADFKII
ncbi:hypothetical protein ACFSOZ_21610 [Mesorhizobium newzealandense]|uniref:Uncharacterized protein n=1 Tax=Mesorhizobium newzealandense TaxID=1300302 RepID=A0ABW4UEX5_9HYPH